MIMTAVKSKTCSKCKQEKPVSDFYHNARGFTAWCKDCLREYSKQRVLDGRDKISKIKHELKIGHDRYNKIPRIAPNKGKKTVSDSHKMVKAMYRNLKKRSLFLHLDFTVTFEEINILVDEFCQNNYHVISLKKHPFKPSIDRVDSSKGYTMGNLKICWMIENLCKNTFSDADVIEFCKRKLGVWETTDSQ